MDEMNTVGTLYIVATPIGNARDMTERGRQILETADIIAAEDTRRSVVLLNKLGIRGNQLSANHKFNEAPRDDLPRHARRGARSTACQGQLR